MSSPSGGDCNQVILSTLAVTFLQPLWGACLCAMSPAKPSTSSNIMPTLILQAQTELGWAPFLAPLESVSSSFATSSPISYMSTEARKRACRSLASMCSQHLPFSMSSPSYKTPQLADRLLGVKVQLHAEQAHRWVLKCLYWSCRKGLELKGYVISTHDSAGMRTEGLLEGGVACGEVFSSSDSSACLLRHNWTCLLEAEKTERIFQD